MRTNKHICIVDSNSDKESYLFRKEKSPEERLSAVELLREHYYIIRGYKTVPRISRHLHLTNPSR